MRVFPQKEYFSWRTVSYSVRNLYSNASFYLLFFFICLLHRQIHWLLFNSIDKYLFFYFAWPLFIYSFIHLFIFIFSSLCCRIWHVHVDRQRRRSVTIEVRIFLPSLHTYFHLHLCIYHLGRNDRRALSSRLPFTLTTTHSQPHLNALPFLILHWHLIIS